MESIRIGEEPRWKRGAPSALRVRAPRSPLDRNQWLWYAALAVHGPAWLRLCVGNLLCRSGCEVPSPKRNQTNADNEFDVVAEAEAILADANAVLV